MTVSGSCGKLQISKMLLLGMREEGGHGSILFPITVLVHNICGKS